MLSPKDDTNIAGTLPIGTRAFVARDQGSPDASGGKETTSNVKTTTDGDTDKEPANLKTESSRLPISSTLNTNVDSASQSPSSRASFLSLPREIRDHVYELALDVELLRYCIFSRQDLGNMEKGHRYGCGKSNPTAFAAAHSLLLTRASTPQIAAEARIIFYEKNNFMTELPGDELKAFLEDKIWSSARLHLRRFLISTEFHPYTMARPVSQLDALLRCPKLCQVVLRLDGWSRREHTQSQLFDALSITIEACQHLDIKLGEGLSFELYIESIELNDGRMHTQHPTPERFDMGRLKRLRDDLHPDKTLEDNEFYKLEL